MNTRHRSLMPRAFTRLELMVVLAVLAMLGAVAWPTLAVSANRSTRLACLNNLRLIGRAFQMWAGDHEGENPWRLPYNNGISDGTRGHPSAGRTWFQFSWVSNQLVTPTILACPSDDAKVSRMARNWGFGPDGFVNSANRNNSISYGLGLHTSATVPQALLSGDRNVRFSGLSECSLIVSNLWVLQQGAPEVEWTNNLHGVTGNLLLNDGRVVQTSSEGLRAALRVPNIPSESNAFHFLTP